MVKTGLILVMMVVGSLLLGGVPARALEGKMAEEFAFLSGQTRVAMDLSSVELQALVERCDRLLALCEDLSPTEKKIMRRKIERLRGLFLYVLQSRPVAREGSPGT